MDDLKNPWTAPTGLVPVRFRATTAQHNAGEIAGFKPEVAARYVAAGIAEYWQPAELAPKDPPADGADGTGSGEPPALDTRTHELTIDGVGGLAEGLTDPAEVARLIAGEQAHPKHAGGRKGALEFLELRAAELAPKA